MGKKIELDEKLVIKEYLKGKSSLILSEEFKVSKPKILKILKTNNVTRYKDRCKSLKIIKKNDKYVTTRKCPKCGEDVKVSSNNKTITCRNYYNLQSSLCKKCSIDNQIGEGNPFYGKTHSKESKEKISNSRKGKSTGNDNPMANPKWKNKASVNLKKKWDSGELEHVRKIMSDTIKNTRSSGKLTSVIRSKQEKKIISEIKKLGYEVTHSLRIETKIFDVFIPSLNLVIEYNGDYWHCNPNKYESTYFHQVKQKTAQELWDYDKKKIDLIKHYGYNLEVVWESDYKKDNTIINKLIKKYDTK